MLNKFRLLVFIFFFMFLVSFQVIASPMPSADLRVFHQRVLKDPSNLDLLYEYAQFAIKEGNFESAIGALEGMLLTANNQPRVLLELGVLYQRLGAFKTANFYLQRAKQLSASNSKIANLADEYLTEVDKEESPHSLNGVFRFGVRYQSNPTFSPEAMEIRSGGFNIPLPESRKRDSDVNALFFSRIAHRYDMTQRASFTTDAIIYGTAYENNKQLNFGVLEVSSGPKFSTPLNAEGQHSVRPHIILRGSRLDGSRFEQTAGAGLDFLSSIGANTLLSAQYQFRDIDYRNYNNRGTASLRNGDEHRLDFRYRSEFMRGHLVEAGLFGRWRDAERQFLEMNQYDITLRYSVKFDNFVLREQRKMTLTPYVIRRFIDYGGADPDIDPGLTRSDREWRVGLNYQFPLVNSWSFLVNIERLEADSNIINYDVTNDLGMVSLQMGF